MGRSVTSSVEMEPISVAGYEKIVMVTDHSVGLKAIIAIHSTLLGPALGGVRIYPYSSFEAALTDVQRLSKGMTYKSALAEVGFGGGKSVILCDPRDKTPEMLISFAQAVEQLGGVYTCAEDSGCSVEDVTLMAQHTPYVVGINHPRSSGNPAPFTAWGTFRGILATLYHLDGSTSVEGKTIAIQGLGNVGSLLADLLFWHGAQLILSDLDWEKTQRLAKQYGAKTASPEKILQEPCDLLAPCAMGGILHSKVLPLLHCRAIAGCANNQLSSDADGDALHRKGILYAPDFVINAGGLINVACETEEEGYRSIVARKRTDQIYDRLGELFQISMEKDCSPNRAALLWVDDRIKRGLGKRSTPPCYPHSTID